MLWETSNNENAEKENGLSAASFPVLLMQPLCAAEAAAAVAANTINMLIG